MGSAVAVENEPQRAAFKAAAYEILSQLAQSPRRRVTVIARNRLADIVVTVMSRAEADTQATVTQLFPGDFL